MADFCSVYEDGSWECFYDDGSAQYVDANGNTKWVDTSGGYVDWEAVIDSGTQAALAILNRSGYPAPDYRAPSRTYNGPIPGVAASAGLNRQGLSTGFNISQNTLMLIAGGVLIFLFAKGRR